MKRAWDRFAHDERWRLFLDPRLRIIANRFIVVVFGLFLAFPFAGGAIRGTLRYPGAGLLGLFEVAGLCYALAWRRWSRLGRILGLLANLAGFVLIAFGPVWVSHSEWYEVPLSAVVAIVLFGVPAVDLVRQNEREAQP